MAEPHTDPSARRVLVVCSHAPGSGFAARESLDLALGFAAFDQDVSLLFTGDGLQCLRLLGAGEVDIDGIAGLLAVMPDYGICRFIVDSGDHAGAVETAAELPIVLEPLAASGIAALVAAHDLVLRN